MTSPVDVSKLREGDVVTVRAKVRSLPILDGCNVEILMEPGGPVYVDPASIVSVEPRPLKVGDRVRSACGTGLVMTVLAIDDASAWVRDDRGGYATYDLPRLIPA